MVRPVMFAFAAAAAAGTILAAPAQAQVAPSQIPPAQVSPPQAQMTAPRQPGAGSRDLGIERVQPDVGGLGVATQPADPARLACRMNLTHLLVAIPPDERAGAWFADLADFVRGDAEPEPAWDRSSCLSLLDEPLVRFDGDLPPTPSWTGSERIPRQEQ